MEKYTDARRYTVWDPPAPASSRKKLPVDPTGTLFFFNCFFPVVFLDVVGTTFFLAGGIGGGWTRALPATERSRLNASSVIDISCSEIVLACVPRIVMISRQTSKFKFFGFLSTGPRSLAWDNRSMSVVLLK